MKKNPKDPKIISREDWEAPAQQPCFFTVKSPVIYVFCMSTHTGDCQGEGECVEMIQKMERIHTDLHHHIAIRYNFVITTDGGIYEGRGWGVQGMLPLSYSRYNDRSLVLGFVGEYLEDTLPRIMRRRREDLVNYGIREKLISENFQAVQIFRKSNASKNLQTDQPRDMYEV